MVDKTFLCKCIICLKENPNGMQLTLNTYNRHRKRQQFLLEKDENAEIQNIEQNEDFQNVVNLNIKEQNQEDILYQKELQTEDIEEVHEYINIDEEDIEDYSDYNNEEYSSKDNRENNKENDDNEEDDDSEENDIVDSEENNDDDDLDRNIMQIDDIPNKKIIDGLKLLHLKSLYNFTESAYNDIIKVFTTNNLSLYKIKKYLKEITELVPIFYDMCENSCICYTGEYESYQSCPIYDAARLDIRGKAKKVMPYLSIINRLKMQFNDKNRAKELLYRYEYITNKSDDDLNDIFDGEIYKKLVDENLFNDKRNVVLTASCDGYQIFKQKTDDCWLFLIVNNNLHPSLRVKKENLLVPFLIPGPNQPKDFNTFLRPFINEMKQLESMHFN
jgi:hypothetical protein